MDSKNDRSAKLRFDSLVLLGADLPLETYLERIGNDGETPRNLKAENQDEPIRILYDRTLQLEKALANAIPTRTGPLQQTTLADLTGPYTGTLTTALQESQEWLSATLKSIGDAVIATSVDAVPTIVFMNPVAEILTGWSLNEARGLPVLEVFNIFNHNTRARAENPIERVIRECRVVGLANHTVLVSRSGTEYVIEDSAAPIVDPSGKMSGVVLVFRDTTAKHLAEQREKALFKQVEAGRSELYNVFMQAPVPIAILLGSEHRFALANSHYVKLSGREVVGKTLFEAFPKEDVAHFKPMLDGVYRTGVPFEGREVPVELPDSSGCMVKRYLNFVYSPFCDEFGAIKGVLAVLQEVTDQVNARVVIERARHSVENERENFRSLFRQTPEMVCMLSGPEHRFEFVNAAHITALTFDATGMTVREAQPESVEVHGILDEVYASGVTAELREIPVTLGPKLRYFNLTYSARRGMDGEVDGVMILGSEITDQIEAKQMIVEAKNAADAANHSKTSFIANMSHEIRTPIGVIIGFCELLQDQEIRVEERLDYLERVIKNAKGLTRIVDDILDIAKVESGKLEIEEIPFSLPSLLHDTVELFSDRAKEKNIRLELVLESSLTETVRSDPTRIRQILINIIGNAVKFTTLGGVRIAAKGRVDAEGRSNYEIRVADTGIGLTEAQIERLFEPFVQAESSTNRKYGGTGLGLAISRRLAVALGGNITVEDSQLGKGSTFIVSFYGGACRQSLNSSEPSLLRSASALSSPASGGLRLAGASILIAEDTIDNQLLVKRILTKNGAIVAIANDGEEAIQMAMTSPVDLILMDVQMPRVDGYEATRALRSSGFEKPIIALTAHAMIEERAKSAEAGCDAHLTKPIVASDLVETIEKHLKGTMVAKK